MAQEILIDKRADGVAVLTLNRPDALNAIDRTLCRELRAAIRDLEADPAVGVTIVAAAGGKSFCVGVDLKERQSFSDDEAAQYRVGELFPMYAELDARAKPSIAAVAGHCLGGGFEIALACDMILATPASTFGLPEVKWGLIPAAGGCRRLPKLIGAARAKEVILAGRKLSADEAAGLGVINRVVAADQLMAAALELAGAVMSMVPTAVIGAKRAIDHALERDGDAAFDIEVSNQCYAAAGRKAGIGRFKKD